MKKKIFSVFLSLFLLLAGVVFSACGNKYENLEYNIEYSYSQDGEWLDGNNGIFLNYGREDDELKLNNGSGRIFVRVQIKNVDAKDVGQIYVSTSGGLSFTSKIVDAYTAFEIPINGNTTTKLKFNEINSNKQKQIDFAVRQSLNSLTANKAKSPTTIIEGQQNIDLTSFNNLNFDPDITVTNQTDVTYSLVSIGSYQDGEYFSSGVPVEDVAEIVGGRYLNLKPEFKIGGNSYVLKVRATSVYHEDITTEASGDIDILILDRIENNNQLFAPKISYASDVAHDPINSVDLYLRTIDDVQDFASTTLYVDLAEFTSQFKTTKQLGDFNIEYNLALKIDGKPFYFKRNGEKESIETNELVIEKTENECTIKAKPTSLQQQTITFFMALKYTNQQGGESYFEQNLNYESSITITKHQLVNQVMVNNSVDDFLLKAYQISSDDYLGVQLTVKVNPEGAENSTIKMTSNGSLDETNFQFTLVSGNMEFNRGNACWELTNNTTFYAKYLGSATSQTLTFSACTTPANFENKPVPEEEDSLTVTINKNISANSFKIFSMYEGDSLLNEIGNEFYVSNGDEQSFYLQVYHDGNNLAANTVKLTSSNNRITFNGKTNLFLTDARRVGYNLQDGNGYYDIYLISINATRADETSTINIDAVDVDNGDLNLGVNINFVAKSVNVVNVANGQDFTILPQNFNEGVYAEAIKLSDGEFALKSNTKISFEVKGKVGNSQTYSSNAVYSVSLKLLTNNVNFDYVEYISSFDLIGYSNGKFGEYSITISYYALNEETNLIEQTSTEKQIKIVVYNTIEDINLTLNNDIYDDGRLTYVNDDYVDARTKIISFSTNNNYTQAIGEEEYKVSQLQINFIEDASYSVYLMLDEGDIKLNDGDILNNGTTDVMNGRIKVQLNSKTSFVTINIRISAVQFGYTTTVAENVAISVVGYNPVASIELENLPNENTIIQNAINSYSIYLSFLGASQNEAVVAQFRAIINYTSEQANLRRFNELVYEIYSVEQDADGEPKLVDGKIVLHKEANDKFIVSIDNGIVTVSATKGVHAGGLYQLVIAAKDSKDQTNSYNTRVPLMVRISDGSSAQNRYVLTNDNFHLINSDAANLSSYYVLGEDITLNNFEPIGVIGQRVYPFRGSITGTTVNIDENNQYVSTTRHKITLTITDKSILSVSETSTTNYYAGLFYKIESAGYANLLNFDVEVSFNISSEAALANGATFYLGALSAVNNGQISNVNVNVLFSKIEITKGNLQFGLIAGENTGSIYLNSASVICDAGITFTISSASVHKIGGIAGVNSGTITGGYKGKASLDSVEYTILNNITINYTSETSSATLNVGGVAGENCQNGNITNIIVGGKIDVEDSYNKLNVDDNGIGGVAGVMSAQAGITKAVALALDIINNTTIPAAGIVARSKDSTISDVRYISAQMVLNSLTSYGKIVSSGVAAGIVAHSYNDTIEFATVENFISSINNDTFYTFNAANVAGLVYELNGGTIDASFVNANIDTSKVNQIYLTVNSADNASNLYFLGSIKNVASVLSKITVNNTQHGYAFVYDNNDVYVSYKDEALSVYENVVTNYNSVEPCKEYNEVIENTFVEVTEFNFSEANFYYTGSIGEFEKVENLQKSDLDYGEYWMLEYSIWESYSHDLLFRAANSNEYSQVNAADGYDPKNVYFRFAEDINNLYVKQDDGSYIKNTEEYDRNQTYYQLTTEQKDWETTVKSWFDDVDLTTDETWRLNSQINSVSVDEFNYYLPYLIKDDEPIMIIYPQKITAEFNKDYVIKTNSIVVDEFNFEDFSKNLTSVLLVNYFETTSSTSNSYNLHYIQNTNEHDGLVNLTTGLEDGSQAGILFEIVSGNDYASIINNQQILFRNGASGKTPIIVKCSSLFNTTAYEYIVFYTHPLASSLTVSGNGVSLSEDGYNVNTNYLKDDVKTLSIGAQNIYSGQSFANIFSGELPLYLNIEQDENSKLNFNKSSNIQDLTYTITSFDENTLSEQVQLQLCLNLSYFGQNYVGEKLEGNIIEIDGNKYLIIANTTINFEIYSSTNSIVVNGGSYSYSTEHTITFTANQYTGFVGSSEYYTLHDMDGYVDEDGYFVVLLPDGALSDSIKLDIVKATANEPALDFIMLKTGQTQVAKLFDFVVDRELLSSGDGFKYTISVSLKNEFNYRYIEVNQDNPKNEFSIAINVIATTNPNISDSVTITYYGTELSSVRIDNYSATSRTTSTPYVDLITDSTKTSSIISPTGYGGVMILHLEPSYSNVTSAILSTDEPIYPTTLNGGSTPVYIYFEQLIYNKKTSKYETYYSPTASQQLPNNGGIKLERVTGKDENGNEYYDGIIYVHTRLTSRFSGYTHEITANLQVTTSNGKTIEEQKTLLTQYLPGVSFDFNGKVAEEDGGYFVQKETNNQLTLRVDGYQYNSNPTFGYAWHLQDDSVYSYQENDQQFTVVTGAIVDNNANRALYENYKNSIYLLKDGKYTRIYETFNMGGRNYTVETFEQFVEFYASLTLANNDKLFIANDSKIISKAEGDLIDVASGFVSYSQGDITRQGDSYFINYRINLHSNIVASVRVFATLSLETENETIVSNYSSVILHPVEYIINSVSVSDVANGMLTTYINQSTPLDLHFTTNNSEIDLTETIWNDILTQTAEGNFDPLSIFYYKDETGAPVYLNATEKLFNARLAGSRILVSSPGALNVQIYMAFEYKFELENCSYSIKFVQAENLTNNPSFTLNILSNTSENGNLIAISNAEQFINMQNGVDYILVNDITLENFSPITANIASLDGNNKVIKIKSFNVTANVANYGLFASVSADTILKNVVVDYSEFGEANQQRGVLNLSGVEDSSIYFGGLVAQNNGLIYNCDVINISNKEDENYVITILSDNDKTLYFGGLTANNNGIITNSRVGRSGVGAFKVISYIDGIESETNDIISSGLTFILGGENSLTNEFVSIAGGFVGTNGANGIISNCYFANSSLINYSTIIDSSNPISDRNSKLAGFVAVNNGSILYSYARAKESTISIDNPQAQGAQIESKSNGIVAGFVFYNSTNAKISNAFANTVLISDSDFMAGFVYNNAGEISEAYSACILNNTNQNDISEQPFVGINEKNSLHNQTGQLINTFYYSVDGTGVVSDDLGIYAPVALNKTSFQNADVLNGFVFIQSTSRTERQQGVWSYYNANNDMRALPELVGANSIAYSYRVESSEQQNSNFDYAPSYKQGSQNNPFIIRNATEFNNVMNAEGANYFAGYARFINNIDFGGVDTNNRITTRLNFILGDATQNRITSIEGNGMTINGIFLNPQEPGAGDTKIGLFAEIEFAYVKNLTLVIDSVSDSLLNVNVRYSGGLAGKINNSTIINVTLNKANQNTTIVGKNFAGALAGMITGNTNIIGVTSNLNVTTIQSVPNIIYNYYNLEQYLTINRANNANREQLTRNYNNVYLANLSFAGGIAGVIDINSPATQKYNISYVNVYGSDYSASGDGSIAGEIAGGVAGYAGKNTSSFKLKYFTANNDKIRGKVAGGLFGVCNGKIEASQVTKEEGNIKAENVNASGQYAIDSAFANYIINLNANDGTTMESALKDGSYGNLSLLGNVANDNCYYAGGLVGVGIGATIKNSYSKATFENGRVIGGLVGLSIKNSITYSYAIPYVSQSAIDENAKIGGLFGLALSANKEDNVNENYINQFEDFENYVTLYNLITSSNSASDAVNNSSVISNTFSTVLLDNQENENINKVDYISGNKYGALAGDSVINTFTQVYVGEYDLLGQASDQNNIKSEQLVELLDSSTPNQDIVFRDIFSNWESQDYWTFNRLRFYPVLMSDKDMEDIEIRNADDFKKYLLANPEGHFVIKNNIDMSKPNWQVDGNWVFNINFSGTLRGDLANGKGRPKVYNLHINTTLPNTTAGLFRSTEGATISNIEFVWYNNDNPASAVTIDADITTFGGVSAEDTDSSFNNLTVHTGAVNNEWNYDVASSHNLLNCNENANLSSFGGIVGKAQGSTINGCTFVSEVNANFNNDVNVVNVGGIVGEAIGNDNASVSISDCGLSLNYTSNNKNVYESTKFNIKSTKSINLGAIVGKANLTAIQNNNVGQNSESKIVVAAELNNSSQNYISGLAGNAENSIIFGNNVFAEISASGSSSGLSVSAAGLAGRYSLINSNIYTHIENNSVLAQISTKENSNFAAAYLSTGVAQVNAGTEININRNVFAGEIKTEQTEQCKISQIYASAALANVSGDNGNVSLNVLTTTTNITVGTTSTTGLYVGEFVGYSNKNVTIANALCAGRIVPSSAKYDSANTHISIGGMVGEMSAAKLTAKLAVSVSSIIANGLSSTVYEGITNNVNINALFGVYKAAEGDLTDVYYSSDYALQPEKNEQAYNISAQTFFDGQTLDLAKFNLWSNTESNSFASGMIYLTQLETQLKRLGILNNTNYYTIDALAPILISNAGNILNGYHYYILSVNADINDLRGIKLDGVFIGGEKEYEYRSDSAIFATINKGSAVSNLHLKLADDLSMGDSSIIANNNSGTIFNCSTTGRVNTSNSVFGTMAYINEGLISYCANSSEIVSNNNSAIAGIAYTNSGTIVSSYFTGYIESNQTSSGIVNSSEEGYLYNNYMAGVVTNYADNGNSFIASSLDANGANNFIDENANAETDSHCEVVKLVSSKALFAANGLQGNWFTVLNGDEFDFTAPNYGYNYLYPVYNFNRRSSSDINTLAYNLYLNYTGTGIGTNVIDKDGASITNFNNNYEILNGLKDANNAYIKNAFKIPHLGVLKAVEYLDTYNLNYMFIYDIDGRGKAWTAVGDGFKGFVFSNKYYKYNENAYENSNGQLTNLDPIVNIRNLRTNGLFNKIDAAYFDYLSFGNQTLVNSGALGVSVSGSGTITVNQIYFKDPDSGNATISGDGATEDANYIATLFGSMENVTVNISNFFSEINEARVTLANSGYAGLFVGKLTSGTINITNANDPGSYAVAFSTGLGTAGGLVGRIEGGIINANGNTVSISSPLNVDVDVNLGGIAGWVSGGTINGVNVELDTRIKAKSFGVLANRINGAITFNNCKLSTTSQITIETSQTEGVYFGYVAAQVDGGEVKITEGGECSAQITYSCGKSTTTFTDDNNKQGFGWLVGMQTGGTITFGGTIANAQLSTINGQNIGGLVGYYLRGSINFSENKSSITLSGGSNVGGWCGFATGFNQANFTNANNLSATLKTSEQYGDIGELYNWGGLFGVLAGGNTIDRLSCSNNININPARCNGEYVQISNVGGICGKIVGSDTSTTIFTQLTYSGGITSSGSDAYNGFANFNEADGIYQMSVVGSDGGRSYAVKAINVGGIFGYAANLTLQGARNTATIMGYQNVGGLIGYANNVTLQGSYTVQYADGSHTEETISIFKKASQDDKGQRFIKDNNNYKPTTSSTASECYVLDGNHVSSQGKIVGVINVGGIIGTANASKLSYLYSQSSVYGNVNVGGAVGNVVNSSTTITNVMLSVETDGNAANTSTAAEIVVSGIIFSEYFETNPVGEQESTQQTIVSFIPTSVGGLVGSAKAGGTFEYNYLNNIKITSANEGAGEVIDQIERTSTVISTVQNYMANVESSNINSNSATYNFGTTRGETGEEIKFETIKFNNIKSGFGGLVGTTNETVAAANSSVKNNYFNTITITAQLGINTGTFYGYVNNNNNDIKSIATPTLMGDVSVSGAYNIGGVAGAYIGQGLEGFSLSNISKLSDTTPTIKIQEDNIIGMYVGSLFGKVNVGGGSGEVKKLTVEGNSIKINIKTNSSYYIGGLIGRLEGNLKGKEEVSNEDGTSTTEYTSKVEEGALTIAGSDVENFGGLVGMLKVASSIAGGTTAEVTGQHNYAFTVNTIENSNYHDAPTNYDYNDKDGDTLNLIAQAYYINQDSFNISASQNTNLYDGNDDCNPLLTGTGAWGWHKTYTGFKTLQRCIPAGESGTNEWDAIQPIYDASNITHVGTIKELQAQASEAENYEYWKDDVSLTFGTGVSKTIGELKEDDYICFTIYEDEPGNPKLYSRVGVGTVYTDDNLEFGTPVDNSLSWWQRKISKETGGLYYIDLNNTANGTQALTYLQWRTGENDNYTTIGNDEGTTSATNMQTTNAVEKYLTYKINTSFYNESKENKDVYFIFDIIYSNSSTSNDGTVHKYEDADLPIDGSIFNVTGVETAKGNLYTADKVSILFFVFVGIELALDVLLTVAMIVGTGGTGAAGGVMATAHTIGKILKVVGTVVAAEIAIMAASYNSSIRHQEVSETFIQRRDETYGVLSQTYSRPVLYNNGKLVQSEIDSFDMGGFIYQVYSSVRPSDYYLHRYVKIYKEDGKNNLTYEYLSSLPNENLVGWKADGSKAGDIEEAQFWSEGQVEPNVDNIDELTTGTKLIFNTYCYGNGLYYKIQNINNAKYHQIQRALPDGIKAENYYQSDGYNFVRGAFNSNNLTYTMPGGVDYWNNKLVYDEENTLTINGNDWTVEGNQAVYSPDSENKSTIVFRADKEVDFVPVDQTFWNNLNNIHEGYQYLQGAYYAAKGDNNQYYFDSSTGGLTKIEPIVARFSYYDTSAPEGEYGVDYIALTVKEEEEDEGYTVYYQFDSQDSSGSTIDWENTSLTEEEDVIYVNTYPYSFKNPYSVGSSTGMKDAYYYVDSEYANISDSKLKSLSFTPTYFYYEGGYVTEGNNVFKPIVNEYYAAKSELPDWLGWINPTEEWKITTTYDNSKITLYNAGGEQKEVTLQELVDGFNDREHDYQNYYLTDVQNLTDEQKKSYKVSANYLLEKEAVDFTSGYEYTYDDKSETYYWKKTTAHKPNSGYNLLYGRDLSVVLNHGTLSTVYFENHTNANDDSYNYNKYLANAEYEFYTRYKFLDGYGKEGVGEVKWKDTDSGVWCWKEVDDKKNPLYYLFKGKDVIPNSGKSTYLSESVVVTFATNGKTIYYKGERIERIIKSTITVS